jgi:hypothetical protein
MTSLQTHLAHPTYVGHDVIADSPAAKPAVVSTSAATWERGRFQSLQKVFLRVDSSFKETAKRKIREVSRKWDQLIGLTA